MNPACYLARHGVHESGHMPECDGRLVRCHLIPKQVLRREAPDADVWQRAVWVWACGGPMGNTGHHGMLDTTRSLRLPRQALPEPVEAVAAHLGLTWWLEREYGGGGPAPPDGADAGRRAPAV